MEANRKWLPHHPSHDHYITHTHTHTHTHTLTRLPPQSTRAPFLMKTETVHRILRGKIVMLEGRYVDLMLKAIDDYVLKMDELDKVNLRIKDLPVLRKNWEITTLLNYRCYILNFH